MVKPAAAAWWPEIRSHWQEGSQGDNTLLTVVRATVRVLPMTHSRGNNNCLEGYQILCVLGRVGHGPRCVYYTVEMEGAEKKARKGKVRKKCEARQDFETAVD